MSHIFKYHATDSKGAYRDGTIEALDIVNAANKLKEQGCLVVSSLREITGKPKTVNVKKEAALKELATRHCPAKGQRLSLGYVKRIQVKQKELESDPEFQKDLAELKKKIGDDLSLDRFKGKKRPFLQAFLALNEFVIKWELEGVNREGRPIVSELSVKPHPKRKGSNLFIPDWVLPQDIRNFLPRLEDFLKGEKVKWGTYTGIRRECEVRNKKIKARFLYLTNRRGLKSGEAIRRLAEEFKVSESSIKQAIYSHP